MQLLNISSENLFDLMYKSIVQASTVLPPDVKNALRVALAEEHEAEAQLHLSTTLENLQVAEQHGRLACADTGFPLYYVKIGNNVHLEGGFPAIYAMARQAVDKATKNNQLRPTMVHPLTRASTGNNVGYYLPKVEIRFDHDVDGIEVTAIPKGGGSEIFGSFYKMLVPADGRKGIIKFILDCAVKASYAGKVCPPAVIGVGIGGSSDICMKIAKEAAILRPMGSRHPEPEIAEMEVELLNAINNLGLGPMGCRGKNLALDLHIEYAVTHTAALPVAFNAQCSICRRATVKLGRDHQMIFDIYDPSWNYR